MKFKRAHPVSGMFCVTAFAHPVEQTKFVLYN